MIKIMIHSIPAFEEKCVGYSLPSVTVPVDSSTRSSPHPVSYSATGTTPSIVVTGSPATLPPPTVVNFGSVVRTMFGPKQLEGRYSDTYYSVRPGGSLLAHYSFMEHKRRT